MYSPSWICLDFKPCRRSSVTIYALFSEAKEERGGEAKLSYYQIILQKHQEEKQGAFTAVRPYKVSQILQAVHFLSALFK